MYNMCFKLTPRDTERIIKEDSFFWMTEDEFERVLKEATTKNTIWYLLIWKKINDQKLLCWKGVGPWYCSLASADPYDRDRALRSQSVTLTL